jgi:hypothetical protein
MDRSYGDASSQGRIDPGTHHPRDTSHRPRDASSENSLSGRHWDCTPYYNWIWSRQWRSNDTVLFTRRFQRSSSRLSQLLWPSWLRTEGGGSLQIWGSIPLSPFSSELCSSQNNKYQIQGGLVEPEAASQALPPPPLPTNCWHKLIKMREACNLSCKLDLLFRCFGVILKMLRIRPHRDFRTRRRAVFVLIETLIC